MSKLPTGTLTFVFTDVEGSTPMWETAPDAAATAMAAHDRLVRRSLNAWNGTFVKGTGDGMLAVFPVAADALAAAVEFQLAWASDSGLESPPRVRVALHTGPSLVRRDDYYGLTPAECARVLSAIHGSQICVTDDTCNAVGAALPEQVELRDLGRHRLRGIADPVRILQAVHPQLRSDFPPLRAVEAFSHNLPPALTSFVGRTHELEEAAALLNESRMVTFVGAGGSGKSRLAVELGTQVADDYPGGVWLVELAALRDPTLVARTIGNALGVPEEAGLSDLDSLVQRLSARRLLLILDNCDHLVAACAEVSERLLTRCPQLKVIATSRQRLNVPGEVALALPPMSVPQPEELDSPEAVAGTDSVQLFTERASLSDPEFRLTAQNCRQVGQICRVVDGIPLAIELAVGKLRSLPLDQIESRLTSRIQMLNGGTGPSRHQTLEQTLEWSYGMLSQTERDLFADLSVFRGGFELDGVERVCRVEAVDDPAVTVGDLIEKSMLTRDRRSGRYRFLEPIRLYAWAMLKESDRGSGVQHRHAEYIAEVVGTASEAGEEARWMDRVLAEHDNIRAALGWSLETAEGDIALEIAGSVWPFWKHGGHVTEGRNWLDRSIDLVGASDPLALESALIGAGDLAASQDDRVAAEQYLTQALQLAEGRGDDVAAATVMAKMASLPHRGGDLPEATRRFEEALALSRRGGDLPQTASILASLALLEEDRGLATEAETHAAEALSLRRKTDDVYAISDALLTLGEISINRGRYVEARRALEEALEIATNSGFRDINAWGTAYLGKLESAEGHYAAGMQLLEQALQQFQERSQPNGAAWAMRHLGQTALAQGDLDRAASLLREALDTALEHVVPDAPLVLEAMSELDVARGDFEEAAYLLSAANRARGDLDLVIPLAERGRSAAVWAAVRSELTPQRFEELEAKGAASTLDDLPALLVGQPTTRT
jgi:predicted ATPase/class 3 adenylate cyclase